MISLKLRKVNSGRRHYFMWELWGYVDATEKLLLGHEESGRFSRGSFLRLPPSETYQGFLIACESESRRAEVKTLIETDTEFRVALTRLMHKEHCHLTVAKEIHVAGPLLLKRVTVLRYITVPIEKEEQVLPWKKDLEFVAGKLRLTYERSGC